MAMNATARLTWYPGTVLPYASLWHTLRRVAALNRLHLIDLQRLTPVIWAKRSPAPELLHNEGGAIDTQALERLLGETPQALAWSHMGHAAPWMRPLFTPGMRICPACSGRGLPQRAAVVAAAGNLSDPWCAVTRPLPLRPRLQRPVHGAGLSVRRLLPLRRPCLLHAPDVPAPHVAGLRDRGAGAGRALAAAMRRRPHAAAT